LPQQIDLPPKGFSFTTPIIPCKGKKACRFDVTRCAWAAEGHGLLAGAWRLSSLRWRASFNHSGHEGNASLVEIFTNINLVVIMIQAFEIKGKLGNSVPANNRNTRQAKRFIG
jgi:hypothetical protein